MNHRRKLLAVLGVLGSATLTKSFTVHAQPPPAKPRRIGFLTLSTAKTSAAWLTAFRAGMQELRWTEGRDYVIDARYANGDSQAGPTLAAELVASSPDLLLVPGDGPARLVAQLTKTIPVVFSISQDPIANGLAASLRQPGGNVTGLTNIGSELWAKRLQLLKEAVPRIAHAAVLVTPGDAGSVSQAQEIAAAAPRLKLRVSPVELRQRADIEAAFKRAAALGVQAYIVTSSGTTISLQREIADRLISLKVPSMFAASQYVEAGGLMSYAASFTDNFRRAAGYVDKIFKGAKPGELPIQQPTRFELVVNLKTAKAIGVTLPPVVMLQADRVIE